MQPGVEPGLFEAMLAWLMPLIGAEWFLVPGYKSFLSNLLLASLEILFDENAMPEFTLSVSDFRVLERLVWSPTGVCILAGTNGAGKTTTLDTLRFLSALFRFGHESALRAVDGIALQRFGADPETPVEFSVDVGNLKWTVKFPVSYTGLKGNYGEELYRDGELMLHASMFDDGWLLGAERMAHSDLRCCAKVLWDRGDAGWMAPLVQFLSGIRVQETYWLNQVKKVESVGQLDSFLHGTGRNLWSVLANWKAASIRYRGQFDWVITEARKAFPDLIGTLEFDRGLPYLFRPGATDPSEGHAPNRAADGLLTGLLHLTAVAGAQDQSLLAFDELENQLHPHAIRSIIAAMRRQAEERGLTIVLTTHSPVVLNAFRDEPEQVYVLDQGDWKGQLPVRMTDLHNDEWLAQANLGALYERLAFASPLDRG